MEFEGVARTFLNIAYPISFVSVSLLAAMENQHRSSQPVYRVAIVILKGCRAFRFVHVCGNVVKELELFCLLDASTTLISRPKDN